MDRLRVASAIGWACGVLACGSSAIGGDDAGVCASGSIRCPCYGNGACDMGLVCISEVCVEDTRCPPGTEGTASCPCPMGGICDAPLSCVSGVCVDASACPPGSEGTRGCPCEGGACGAGLVCSAGACVDPPACPVGTNGCPCDSTGGCLAGLACGGGTCSPASGCVPGTLDCPCDSGTCSGPLTCSAGVCRTPAGSGRTYFFGAWGRFSYSPVGPIFVARYGELAARPIALPLAVGDMAVPRLVDFVGSHAGFAVYEDVDGMNVHALRLAASGDAWEELPLPPDTATQQRMTRYLVGRWSFPGFDDPLVPASSSAFPEMPNVLMQALDADRVVIVRLVSDRVPDALLDAACPPGSGFACLLSWLWDGSAWTERAVPYPIGDTVTGEPGIYSSDGRTVFAYERGAAGGWATVDLETGVRTDGPLVFAPTYRIGREAVYQEGDTTHPGRLCVRDHCSDVDPSLSHVRAWSWTDPTILYGICYGACSPGLRIADLPSTSTIAVPVPSPSSELELCAGFPEPDGAGLRLLFADTDITNSVLEFTRLDGAATMTAADGFALTAFGAPLAVGGMYDACIGLPGSAHGTSGVESTVYPRDFPIWSFP